MTVTVSPLPDRTGIALAGALTMASAARADADGRRLLAALAGRSPWICDLSALTVAGSAAAAVLLSWQRLALQQQATLQLRQVPPRLSAILSASNLSPVFEGAPA